MSASGHRMNAKKALEGKWGLAVGAGIVATILGGATVEGDDLALRFMKIVIDENNNTLLYTIMIFVLLYIALIWTFITLIVGPAVQLGYIRLNKNILANQSPKFADLFSRFHMFGKAFVLRLFIVLKVLAWYLLLIIPGLIAFFRYYMAPFILEENPDMSVGDAIKHSKYMMKGNKWKLFCLHFSFIGWYFLSILTCGIGLFWLMPYIRLSEVSFYTKVSKKYWKNITLLES